MQTSASHKHLSVLNRVVYDDKDDTIIPHTLLRQSSGRGLLKSYSGIHRLFLNVSNYNMRLFKFNLKLAAAISTWVVTYVVCFSMKLKIGVNLK